MKIDKINSRYVVKIMIFRCPMVGSGNGEVNKQNKLLPRGNIIIINNITGVCGDN